MPFMARVFSTAGIHADQVARTVKETFNLLFAVQMIHQCLTGYIRLGTIQSAGAAVQALGQFVRNFQGQRLHRPLVTPDWRIDNTEFCPQTFMDLK